MKNIYAYKNTSSSAGSGTRYDISPDDVIHVNCWFNLYGNPSYCFFMNNGDTYYLVDDFGAMNNINHLSRNIVNRKKDLFNLKMSEEKHFNTGNQYAKKEDKKDSFIQMRIERDLKARFVSNLYKYEKLSEFITLACINECRLREKGKPNK